MGLSARTGAAVLFVAAFVLATPPRIVNIDSSERFESLAQLLRGDGVPGTKYSLIGPLFAAPLWAVGERSGDTVAAVWLFNRLVTLVAAGGLWWAVRPALGADASVRFLVAAGLLSMLPYHLSYFGGEVFTAAGVGVGTAAAVVRGAWWGWPLAAVGAANVPGTIPALALAAVVDCWGRRRWTPVLAVGLAVGLVFVENAVRRGHPLAGGYDDDHGVPTVLPYSGRPGFSYPLYFGLLSVLLSFGKGLVWFAPGLFVPPGVSAQQTADAVRSPEAWRHLHRVWLAFVVGLVLVYARWWAWYGGVFWGPRFFLFAGLPAALVLVARTLRPGDATTTANAVTLGVGLLSAWVGANGAVWGLYADDAFMANGYALEFVTWYVPECSPLWWPFVVPKPLSVRDGLRLAGFAVAAAYLLGPVAVELVRRGVRAVRTIPRPDSPTP